jgi:hypothetical protein
MTSIETYVRYEDVFGTSSTMEQLETVLRSLDLGLVLRIFGPINTICSRRGLPNHDAAQAGLIRELFDESTIQRIRRYFESQGRLVTVFHRKQCLFVMREAMRLCPDLPGMDPNQIKEELAALSLVANEHASATAHRGPVSADSFVTMMCDFIPITEANELKFDIASISRMHKIIHDIAPARAASKPFFEVPALFQTASGISLETYEALSLAVLPRILKSAEDVLTHSHHYGVRFDYFSQTKLAQKDRDVFFSLLARTPEQFRARLQNTTPGWSARLFLYQ